MKDTKIEVKKDIRIEVNPGIIVVNKGVCCCCRLLRSVLAVPDDEGQEFGFMICEDCAKKAFAVINAAEREFNED